MPRSSPCHVRPHQHQPSTYATPPQQTPKIFAKEVEAGEAVDAEGNPIAPQEHAHSFGHFIAWKQLKQKLKADTDETASSTQTSVVDKPPLIPQRIHAAYDARLRDVWASSQQARELTRDPRGAMRDRRDFRGSKGSPMPLGHKRPHHNAAMPAPTPVSTSREKQRKQGARHPNVHDHVILSQSPLNMLLTAPSISRPGTSMSAHMTTTNFRMSF